MAQTNETRPTVSVIITALNASSVLPLALDSIRAQDYPDVVETIVAVGDSATATVAKDAGAIVIQNPSGKTPVGLNLAVGLASGDVVVRCDAQSVLPPGYVTRAVETLQRTGAVNVGGMQVPAGATYTERGIGAAMASRLGAGDARYRVGGEEGPAETVYLGVFDRRRLEDLGGFDEAFSRNQDYELNHRIIESGGVVWFDPELKVSYRPRGSMADLWTQYYQYGQAKKLFMRHHPGSLRWRQLAPPLLVVALITSLLAAILTPWTLLIPVGYVFGLILGTLLTPGRIGANLTTVPALATMHVAWGLGFMNGIDSTNSRP